MEVFKKTISTVFGQDRRYVIPLFQRPYVWTRENQWEPLWEDLRKKADDKLCSADPDSPPHFLGAIVIQQRQSYDDQLLAHDVIDGQQRLTTLQILLSAFHDIVATMEDKQILPSLVAWTRNQTAISNQEVEQFKVWPTGRDVEQYRLVMTAGSAAAIEKIHPPVYRRKRLQTRPRMVEAYLYFHGEISAWLNAGGPDAVVARVRVLRRVFDQSVHLVSIELGKLEDPQAIFETLNARGVPLLASDLLRNYIFQRVESPKDAERLHGKYWARFEVPNDPGSGDGPRFWEVEERQGRLSRARLDLFVHHYLTMKRGDEILASRLFPEYKKWIESEKPFASLDAELAEFAGFSDRFKLLLQPPRTGPLGRFARRLKALDTSTVYPLVLGLLGNAALAAADVDGILVDLESFLVRRLVCARPTKNYNRLFVQLLQNFEKVSPSREAFRGLLSQGTGETVDWPDDSTFERGWMEVDAYTALKPIRVEMILRAIEEELHTAESEDVAIGSKLTVEHVLPQEWRTHWPLPEGVDEEIAIERREELLHDFGNLTLLTQPLNSKVSNGPAAEKLAKIAGTSLLSLTKYFHNRATWTEEDIVERGRALFQVAKRIWPGP